MNPKIPVDDSRIFIFNTSTTFLICDTSKFPQCPSYYLVDRNIRGFNCEAKVFYQKCDITRKRPLVEIYATKSIKIGDPIVIYYEKFCTINSHITP